MAPIGEELTPEEDKAEQEKFEREAAESVAAEAGEQPPAPDAGAADDAGAPPAPDQQQEGGAEDDGEAAKLWAEMAEEEEGTKPGKSPPSTDDEGNGKDSTSSINRGTGGSGEGKSGDRPSEPASPPADIWASASPELRAAHEAEVKRLRTEAARRQAADAGRIAKLSGKRPNPADTAARKVPEQPQKKVTEVLDEELRDYPEIAEPLKKTLGRIEQTVEQLHQAETTRVANARAQEEAAEVARLKGQQELLDKAHPDWETDIVYGKHAKTFFDWINDPIRPRKFHEAVFKTNNERISDAAAAIEVFDAFKADLKLAQQPPPDDTKRGGQRQELSAIRAAQLDGGRSPRSPGGAPVRSGIPKEGDPQAIWDAFKAEDPEEERYQTRKRA